MSEILLGVLRMPPELFWSDDELARLQHDNIRREAADEIERLQAELARELQRRFDGNEQASREHREDVAWLIGLLEHAQCQNCDVSGARYDNYGEPEQCQWCHERAEAIAAHRSQGGGV